MKIKSIIQGRVQTNSYIISNQEKCILIDPEGDISSFVAYIENKHLTPVAILLTHGHFDHIGAVDALKELYHLPVYASAKEVELLKEPSLNLSTHIGKKISVQVDHTLQDLDILNLADLEITVWETPGHTSGSVCYFIEDHIFSGDTIFEKTYGRIDFPTGNKEQMISSIHRILSLEKDYVIHPGHGDPTTVFEEQKQNPLRIKA